MSFSRKRWVGSTGMGTALVLALLSPSRSLAGTPEDSLSAHRNLGRAFYENPSTAGLAVEEFRRALETMPGSVRERVNYGLALLRAGQTDRGIAELRRAQNQDPSVPHTWFNLGIAYKRLGRFEEAVLQLEGMANRVPREPITHYNLGVLFDLTGHRDRAVGEFEAAARLGPWLAGPHFRLATAYRRDERAEDAQRALATFRRIREARSGEPPEDLQWCVYSEVYEPLDPVGEGNPGPLDLRLEPELLARGLDPQTAGLLPLDADGDGRADLLAWSSRGILLFIGGKPVGAGLEGVTRVLSVASGDWNNDGWPDLCVLEEGGPALYLNEEGRFRKSPVAFPPGRFRQAIWMDADHDYDLDLLLLGDRSVLMQNRGRAGFVDRTAQFPFQEKGVQAGALAFPDPDLLGMDVALAFQDRPGVRYSDRLAGNYAPRPLPSLPPGMASLLPCDPNRDGWPDLAVSGPSGIALLLNDRRGGFRPANLPRGLRGPLAMADLGNRGVSDLITGEEVLPGLGDGTFGPGKKLPEGLQAVYAADFDDDGRTDLAVVGADGVLSVLYNRVETRHGWLGVSLEGIRNPKLAAGAVVEVKAGTLYQKRPYDGLPLLFGLGSRRQVDVVRITWPNGLIQNETRLIASRREVFREAQRLSGSCPMIFSWNGGTFEFITDVLGVAPLGASTADGSYFAVDHDEVVSIPGNSLATSNGLCEIRVTEELREVSYLDAVRLTAVDHPADLEVLTNEKFKGQPFPESRLFGIRRRIVPRSARDDQGRDVLPLLVSRDGTWPDGFPRTPLGVAGLHRLDLDFGRAAPDNRSLLILNGWVDWADGSTFLGASQEDGRGLVFPILKVRDETGEWRTVIEDMGIPAGKPKTIVVDLTGKFLCASRQIRIETNLCVYWDEICMSEETAPPEVRLTDLPSETADLRFRGFSRVVVHPERKRPEQFIYGESSPLLMWNPIPGLYTRYGDVLPLLGDVDDRLVVMGAGDELRLGFDGQALPVLPPGWSRDYLLVVDGWAKDGDFNTAFSRSVEPLPFHGMPGYPYPRPWAYPEDESHRSYRARFNTRPALRLIPPLHANVEPTATVPQGGLLER